MQRFTSAITRAEVRGDTLHGYGAVFDKPTTRQNQFKGTETIARGAFDGAMSDDVVALVNHDMSQLLGRTSSGTLRLAPDDTGLGFDLDLPDTQLGHDVRVLVERGDLVGMSFSALLGEIERAQGGVVHRSFKQLIDVSVVTSPAYRETSVALRSEALNATRVREQLLRARARVEFGVHK